MEMKFAPASLAIAFATSVFPHPGGPYNKTPVASGRPIACKPIRRTSVFQQVYTHAQNQSRSKTLSLERLLDTSFPHALSFPNTPTRQRFIG
jgi:hypothetical protein